MRTVVSEKSMASTVVLPVVTDLIMADPEATAAFIGYAVKSGTA